MCYLSKVIILYGVIIVNNNETAKAEREHELDFERGRLRLIEI